MIPGVTEIVGTSAAGKTQICMQLSLCVQLPTEQGGLGGGMLVGREGGLCGGMLVGREGWVEVCWLGGRAGWMYVGWEGGLGGGMLVGREGGLGEGMLVGWGGGVEGWHADLLWTFQYLYSFSLLRKPLHMLQKHKYFVHLQCIKFLTVDLFVNP